MLRAYYTVYVDKPMRGHGLMQANRVFRDKPSSLVVDYLGLAHELKRALSPYTRAVAAASAKRPEGGRAPHRQKAHRGHTLPSGRGEPHRPCAPRTGRSGRLGHFQRVEIPIDPQVEDGREEFGPRSMGLISSYRAREGALDRKTP